MRKANPVMSGADEFREALTVLFQRASTPSVQVSARGLHDTVMGRSSRKNRMPICCSVMWQEFDEATDSVISAPPSGKGGTLTLRYVLPRPSFKTPPAKRRSLVATGEDATSFNEKSIFAPFRGLAEQESSLLSAARQFTKTKSASLKTTVAAIQIMLRGASSSAVPLSVNGVPVDVAFRSALLLKAASAQVNEVVHATAILLAIPRILEAGETVVSTSLAAGNTGTPYDLETDRRVAEFKIIDWKGADSVRESQLFKDFFVLAESPTPKRKYLYVTGVRWALNALRKQRTCKSSLKPKLAALLAERHPEVTFYSEYFEQKSGEVNVIGLDELLWEFANGPINDAERGRSASAV